MIGRWFADFVSQIKWLLLIAIAAGPAWSHYNWTELEKVKRVAAEGTEVSAVVDGGESRSRRRSGTSYTIHAIWPGDGNVQHAEDISVTSEYAKQIIADDMLLIDTAQIKYMPDGSGPTFVVDDIPRQQADKELMIWLGIAAGVIGAIASATFFFIGRRRATA